MTVHSRKAAKRILALAVALTASGCSASDDPLAEATQQWALGASPIVSIGEVDGDPHYILSRVVSVNLLSGARVVIGDGSSGTLRVYDGNGRFERQMGGRGEGPGEFIAMAETVVLPPDTLATYDLRAYRLTKFRIGGEVASTVTLHAPDGYPEIYLGQYSDGDQALAWISQVAQDPSRVLADHMRVARFGLDGGEVSPLSESPGMRRAGSPVPFSPHFVAALVGDTIFFTDGVNGRMVAVGPMGDTVRIFQVHGEPIRVEDAFRELALTLDSASAKRLGSAKATAGLDTIPLISDMLADNKGRLWLKKYSPATDSHWVFRPRTGGEWIVVATDGNELARVRMPDGFRPTAVRDDRVAGVARDELGVEQVRVYELLSG